MSGFRKLTHAVWHCQSQFWARAYAVDTIGFDAEMIRKYVKYQEDKERREEQLCLNVGD